MRSWSKWKIFSRKWIVLEQGRAARADLEGVLVVGDRHALLGGEHGHVAAGDLVRLAAAAAHDLLFAQLGRFELLIISALFCHRNSFPYWDDCRR